MHAMLVKYWRTVPPHKQLILALIFFGVLITHASPLSWNDASRVATVQSLVESGSFVIDNTLFAPVTGDKVFIHGHFYSEKPPATALLGAVVYWPLYHIGLKLDTGTNVAFYIMTLLTIKVPWLLGTLAFYYALRFTGLNEQQRVLASVPLGFASLYFSWSSVFNNHGLAAAFLSIGLCFFLKARHEQNIRRDLAISGFSLSLACSADIPTGVFYAGFLVYILCDRNLRPYVVYYVLPTLLTVVPELAVNYSIHDSIVPVQIVRSYFEYPGSPWIGSDELSGMRVNDPGFIASYAFLTLIGPKGFLVYNPFLFVALWGLIRVIRQRDAAYAEGLVVAVGSGIIAAYYWLTTTNYGGFSYSVRWFVPLLPLLLYFTYPYFALLHRKNTVAYRALLVCSLVLAAIGAVNPWSRVGNTSDIRDAPLVANVCWIMLLFPGIAPAMLSWDCRSPGAFGLTPQLR
jgi:hypothetical protein